MKNLILIGTVIAAVVLGLYLLSRMPREVTAASGGTGGATTMPGVTSKEPEVVKSEAQWRKELTAEQYRVLREKGTEAPFTNQYDHFFEAGTYSCAACGQELFTSETKFDSGCGWPAFYAAKAGERVKLTSDVSFGMIRTEVTCARCGSHLGHLFDDAPQTPTGQRYCINSVSVKFTPAPATQPATRPGK
jgi:peptide-methionine (R)-S-oxide reductase